MANDPDHFLGKSLHQFQRFVRQSGAAAGAAYTLMGAILFLGALGFFFRSIFSILPFMASFGFRIRYYGWIL
jgi:hypothetical protein